MLIQEAFEGDTGVNDIDKFIRDATAKFLSITNAPLIQDPKIILPRMEQAFTGVSNSFKWFNFVEFLKLESGQTAGRNNFRKTLRLKKVNHKSRQRRNRAQNRRNRKSKRILKKTIV